MFKVMASMSQRLEKLRSHDARDDDIIETFHALVTMVDQLKTPAGTQFASLFPHIAMDGVKVSVDYSRAIAMNKTILQEVAAKRDEEGPLLKSLEEIKHEITHVQKEVDLIREFQMRHARISADQVAVPMVDGAPKPLIGDSLHIQERPSMSLSDSGSNRRLGDQTYPSLENAPFPPPPPSYPTPSYPTLRDRK